MINAIIINDKKVKNLQYVRLSLLLVVAVSFSACSHTTKGALPPSIEKKEHTTSTITIARNNTFVASGHDYIISFDGNDVVSLNAGEYSSFETYAGNHTVSVRCFNPGHYFYGPIALFFSPEYEGEIINIVSAAGEEQYFLLSPSFDKCAKIAQDTKNIISNSAYIKYGTRIDTSPSE